LGVVHRPKTAGGALEVDTDFPVNVVSFGHRGGHVSPGVTPQPGEVCLGDLDAQMGNDAAAKEFVRFVESGTGGVSWTDQGEARIERQRPEEHPAAPSD